MPSRFVLGPSSEVIEPGAELPPAPTAPNDATLEIVAYRPTGNVDLNLPAHAPEVNHPINVYVFCVTPPNSVPADKTPDWFFASGCLKGQCGTKDLTGAFSVDVPGMQPGTYFLQTVLEFAA